MSRSRKKVGVMPVCKLRAGERKKDRQRSNEEVRQTGLEDMPDGNHYRKMVNRWMWADDGKTFSYVDDPKSYRK